MEGTQGDRSRHRQLTGPLAGPGAAVREGTAAFLCPWHPRPAADPAPNRDRPGDQDRPGASTRVHRLTTCRTTWHSAASRGRIRHQARGGLPRSWSDVRADIRTNGPADRPRRPPRHLPLGPAGRGRRDPRHERMRQVDAPADHGRSRHAHDGRGHDRWRSRRRASTRAARSPSRSPGSCRGGRSPATSRSDSRAGRRGDGGPRSCRASCSTWSGLTAFAGHRPREVSGGMAQRSVAGTCPRPGSVGAAAG